MRFLIVLALLSVTSLAQAQPIPPCRCGCMETGLCKCKNCAERTADPTWRPIQAATPKVITTHETGGPLILGSSPMTFQLKPVAAPPACPNGLCPLQAPKLAPGAAIPQPMPWRPPALAFPPVAAPRGLFQTMRDNMASRREARRGGCAK